MSHRVVALPLRPDCREIHNNSLLPVRARDPTASCYCYWLHAIRGQEPDKPWFMYYSTGCSHAPHHVPSEWSEKYRGRFDAGWDAYREETFERQKQLGVIPTGR